MKTIFYHGDGCNARLGEVWAVKCPVCNFVPSMQDTYYIEEPDTPPQPYVIPHPSCTLPTGVSIYRSFDDLFIRFICSDGLEASLSLNSIAKLFRNEHNGLMCDAILQWCREYMEPSVPLHLVRKAVSTDVLNSLLTEMSNGRNI